MEGSKAKKDGVIVVFRTARGAEKRKEGFVKRLTKQSKYWPRCCVKMYMAQLLGAQVEREGVLMLWNLKGGLGNSICIRT